MYRERCRGFALCFSGRVTGKMNAPSVRWGWREASKSTAEQIVGDPGTPHPSQASQQMTGDSRISSWKPPIAQGDGGFTLLG